MRQRKNNERSVLFTLKVISVLGLLHFFCFIHESFAAPITLNLNMSWTDRLGGAHPARNVQVEFWDADVLSPDDLLDIKQTNNAGLASTVQENTDEIIGLTFLDPYMRVFALSNAAFVSSDGTFANTYGIQTPTVDNVPGPTHTVNATAGNVTNTDRAFSVHQAIQFHRDYANSSLVAVTPQIAVRFPSDPTGTSAGGAIMNVEASVWSSWDVIHHEYGHNLADNNNLDGPNLGLAHSFGQDQITPHGNDQGTRLAWQEGIATYLGLSAQDAGALKTVIPGLPAELGDEFYDDPDGPLHVGIESDAGPVSVGEGDEASVMRILWDLYDTDMENYFFDDEYADKWTLGDKTVFDLMKGNQTLRDMWVDVATNHTPNFKRRSELGEVFEEYGVSSVLTNPMDDVLVNPGTITFQWNEQNSNHSALFKVLVFDAAFANIIDQSPTLNDVFQWTSNIGFFDGNFHWVVLNNSVLDAGIHLTNSYWSGSYEFAVAPEPGTMLLFGLGLVVSTCMARRRFLQNRPLALHLRN